MEKIFTRTFRIVPTDSPQKKKKETETLIKTINTYLYIAANAIIEECRKRYWNKPVSEIPFLVQFSQVKQLSEQLDELHIKKVIAIGQDNKEEVKRLEHEIVEIQKKKFELRNMRMKRDLAEAC